MPLAVLLVGITGSGKTTVAQALADHGYTRLSVDEEVHRLHGRYGVDYPEHTYFERQRPVVEAIRARLVQELEAEKDVVLDHGLWRRSERDSWQQAACEAGGHPVLVYLPADREELLRRLAERNRREDANALTVTPEALDDFFDRFDAPADVEEVIVYTGDLDALMMALSTARHREG
ncbi:MULTISPECIES: ATP-binding protein [unclassified Streptomyces]|uniref:AAA family ATPase n=1 Tax=Streptomyces TaxID=1883 RepID=UPI000D5208A5|nr:MULTISPECIES: ATP-binding protein [unclassified Streptomyces]PVD06648.1 ATP-binding protein [Streptomyces sp. CS147]UCA49514.1 ATP-binding protein [Streptomyces sp. WA6-1-16]